MRRENPLKRLVRETCFSVTGSDPAVLAACMRDAKERNCHFICEATVNQVNQFGGYTGMRPADYVEMVCGFADELDFPRERIILSGDHLGPFVWRHLEAREAMEHSCQLVREYVKAGFRKIHLDPTMPLGGDDPESFGNEIIAQRAVELARAAEEAYETWGDKTIWDYRPAYVIGSEVPVPGGTERQEGMQVTSPQALRDTLECFREAFLQNDLSRVWEDTVAVVAQIGLEFSEDHVYDFCHEAALPLAQELGRHSPLVFESHSSDYQTPASLRRMVEDGVGILKVGPELTFAHREALISLSLMERELAGVWEFTPANFPEVLETVMLEQEPDYWRAYYHGTQEEQRLKRRYSYSDRCRYYFAEPRVKAARERLLENLSLKQLPLYLVSQYFPVQYERIREGKLSCTPRALLEDRICQVMDRYYDNMLKAKKRR